MWIFFSRNIFSLINCTLNNIQFVLAPHWKTPRIVCHYDGLGLPIDPQICLEFLTEDTSHWSNFPFWVPSMTLDPQGLCSCLSLVFLTPIFPTPNTITSFPFYTFLLGVIMMTESTTRVWDPPILGLKWSFRSIALFLPIKSIIRSGTQPSNIERNA